MEQERYDRNTCVVCIFLSAMRCFCSVLNRLQQFLREKAPLVGSPLVLPAAGVSERRTEAYFRDPQQGRDIRFGFVY